LSSLIFIKSRELHVPGVSASKHSRSTKHRQSLREGCDLRLENASGVINDPGAGLVLLFGSNFNVVLPLLAVDVLHVGATGFGLLSAASGVGALLSAFWLAWSNQKPTIHSVLIGACSSGVWEQSLRLASLSLSLVLNRERWLYGDRLCCADHDRLQTVVPDHLRRACYKRSVLFFDGSLPLGICW